MKRRTFLKIVGLSSAPILPLIGDDLDAALQSKDNATTLIRVATASPKGASLLENTRLFHFQVPVGYNVDEDGVIRCIPITKSITFEAVYGHMRITKVQVRTPIQLVKLYESLGLDGHQWISLEIKPVTVPAGTTAEIEFSEEGLWSFGT